MSAYTIDNLVNDLIVMLVAYVYVLLTIFIPLILKKKDIISKFTARKAVHMFAGLAILSSPFYVWPFFPTIIAGSLTVLVYFSSKESKVKQLKELYEAIGEEAEERVGYLQGPFFYCLSITLLVFIFALMAPDKFYFPIAGILIMIVSDTIASVIGKRFGKRTITLSWTGTTRSLEGSLAFLITSFAICLFSLYFFGLLIPNNQAQLTWGNILIFSIITSVSATIIEQLSPSTYDDLSVPLISTLIIFLFSLPFI
ncbi:MAG: diacylglycerol/polyprenol kinase family protein [Promethearchaeota archaeon]